MDQIVIWNCELWRWFANRQGNNSSSQIFSLIYAPHCITSRISYCFVLLPSWFKTAIMCLYMLQCATGGDVGIMTGVIWQRTMSNCVLISSPTSILKNIHFVPHLVCSHQVILAPSITWGDCCYAVRTDKRKHIFYCTVAAHTTGSSASY